MLGAEQTRSDPPVWQMSCLFSATEKEAERYLAMFFFVDDVLPTVCEVCGDSL